MTLATGDRVGVYEVTGLLGVGGMGEVYRARDTKLGREVALKTLPSAFASDRDRLARFEREARLLASLNHPCIAAVYGLDEHAGTLFLTMELVEGVTLDHRLRPGGLPIEEALPLALQIAEALDAAHERGVVHRDLKPANIMVTEQGRVKVLDFGLAKALEAAEPDGTSPGASPSATELGIILGTAAYMSPEQARGRRVDKRTDIWAFGCVLYEMLTGRPAFDAGDTTGTLARVLERSPEMQALPRTVPPSVRRTIELCLQKELDKRIRDIGDVRLALEGAFGADASSAASQPSARRGRTRLVAGAVGLALGAVLAGVAAWTRWPTPAPRPVSRFDYPLPERQTLRSVGRPVLALSPDGRSFVYNTNEGLYLREMDTLEPRLLRGTEADLTSPFFSPDGRYVAYWEEGQIKRVATLGGAPIAITDGVSNPFGASWSPDGSIVFGQPDGIFRVAASGGTPERVIPIDEGARVYGPQLMPDGDSVLFSLTTTTWDAAQIVVESLSTHRRTVLVEGGSDARYVSSGRLVYALGNALFALVFDARRATVSGAPLPLVQGVLRAPGGLTAAANYGVADDGTLVYTTGGTGLRYGIPVWVDAKGREDPVGIEPCLCAGPLLSPDGTRLALTSGTLEGDTDIYVWSFAGRTLTRLTFEPGLQLVPLWSPDGQRIAYASEQGLFVRRADGAGDAEQLATGKELLPWSWTADGRIVLQQSGAGSQDIAVVAVAARAMPEPLLKEDFKEARPTLSPDGRWLAYESDESGRTEIYVRPFPNVTDGKWQVSAGGGENPKWTRDGRTLYYLSPTALVAVPIEAQADFRWGKPSNVLDRNRYMIPPASRAYEISPDGERLLLLKDAGAAAGTATAKFVVVQNLVGATR
jgi:eukaryotic-like serine/threonine-protein kinase